MPVKSNSYWFNLHVLLVNFPEFAGEPPTFASTPVIGGASPFSLPRLVGKAPGMAETVEQLHATLKILQTEFLLAKAWGG